jgi:hypothetical protein
MLVWNFLCVAIRESDTGVVSLQPTAKLPRLKLSRPTTEPEGYKDDAITGRAVMSNIAQTEIPIQSSLREIRRAVSHDPTTKRLAMRR